MQNICFMMIIIQMNCFFCMGWIEIDNDNEKKERSFAFLFFLELT